MATDIWVNIGSGNGLVPSGSGNGLLPDGTKPLPEPMLTYHKYGPVTLIWGNQEIYSSEIYFESPRGQWVNLTASYDLVIDRTMLPTAIVVNPNNFQTHHT